MSDGSIIIPASVTSLGTEAFSSCPAKKIVFLPGSKLQTLRLRTFSEMSVESITIPASVEDIVIDNPFLKDWWGGDVYNTPLSVREVVFEPNSKLKKIGKMVFYKNTLGSITTPASVESIEDEAFKDSTVEEVIFEPNSKLKSIGIEAFSGTNIKSIIIPNSVEVIGKNAFKSSSLEQITFAPGSKLRSIACGTFIRTKLKSITIPSSVLQISDEAFRDSTLEKVTLESNSQLQKIGALAFAGCELKSFTTKPTK